jgi:phospholipase/carboxylesterase
MELRTTQVGGLRCRIVKGPSSPKVVVVLCHGFGAPGSDLVPLAEEAVMLAPSLADNAAFVFPEAPIPLTEFGGDSRAWWRLEMARFQNPTPEMLQARREGVPEGLAEVRRLLMGLVSELSVQWKLPLGKFVLGGFSQGAMLATDVTFRLEEAPAALVLFSGTLICQDDWTKRAAARRGLTVLVSHGRQDPLLPFAETQLLLELLRNAGLEVKFIPFEGPHTIALPALEAFAAQLNEICR